MGIHDGRLLENRSVALIKLEVDVATSQQLSDEASARSAADAATNIRIDNLIISTGVDLAAHTSKNIRTAHSGTIDSDNQIDDTSIKIGKLAFTPALQGDFALHIGDGSIHFKLGNDHLTAAYGNHNHDGVYLPASYVPPSGMPLAHASTHIVGGTDGFSGQTLNVSITGSAYYAS